MPLFKRLKKALDRSQEEGCETSNTVTQFQQDYERQADEADRRLQEKQERDLREFLRNNS